MFKNYFTIIDELILILNIGDIIIMFCLGKNFITFLYPWSIAIRNLKAFRLFKILYEQKLLKSISIIFYAFCLTAKKIFYFIFFILIICVTFSCIGSELFAFKALFEGEEFEVSHNPEHGESYRVNHDTFMNSVLAMITCFLSDEWFFS